MFKEQQSRKLMTSGDVKSLESMGIMDTFLSYLQSNSTMDPISNYRAKLSQLLQSTPALDADEILAKVKSISILHYEVALLLARVSKMLSVEKLCCCFCLCLQGDYTS
jgi:hypothetical protein